jgi:hypothetical protein
MVGLHGLERALWWAERHKETMRGVADQKQYWESVVCEISRMMTEKESIDG